MKKVLLIMTALLVLSCVSLAQGQAGANGKSVTGCLSGPNDEGAYVLKTKSHSIEVGGNDELKNHVGHEVRLTGTWAKSGTEIGENEKSEAAERSEGKEAGEHTGAKAEAGETHERGERNERHLKVEKIDMVSTSCSTTK